MKCLHCGADTERLHIDQRYCPLCEIRVNAQIKQDQERQSRRVWRAKILAETAS